MVTTKQKSTAETQDNKEEDTKKNIIETYQTKWAERNTHKNRNKTKQNSYHIKL